MMKTVEYAAGRLGRVWSRRPGDLRQESRHGRSAQSQAAALKEVAAGQPGCDVLNDSWFAHRLVTHSS
jgi:hypothetical protein